MKPQAAEGQHDRVVVPGPMRIALVASVAIVLYLGLFPDAVLEFARESVGDLGALNGAMPEIGQ